MSVWTRLLSLFASSSTETLMLIYCLVHTGGKNRTPFTVILKTKKTKKEGSKPIMILIKGSHCQRFSCSAAKWQVKFFQEQPPEVMFASIT